MKASNCTLSVFYYRLCYTYALLISNTFVTTRVQRSRLLAMLKAVDPLGTALRGVQLNIIQRRSNCVGAPLELWHIDGNHKLIK